MSDQETFKSVSVAALRHAHQAIAEKAIDDDQYLPIFAELDAQMAEYEQTRDKESAVLRARAKLRMRKSA